MYLVTNMSNVPTAYKSTRNEIYIMKEKAATRLDIITYLKFSLLLFIAFFALFSLLKTKMLLILKLIGLKVILSVRCLSPQKGYFVGPPLSSK